MSEDAGGVRLQKFLASAGVASRRKAEELIVAGRVQVNSQRVTTLGTKVDPERDLVTVDGRLVSRREGRSYYLLYKPPGCVTTASDPEGRPTALDYLRDVKERVFSVGRLDFDAEGAVLFTDDGELANRLAHPRYGHQRVYLAKVRGEPPASALERMVQGVRLEDGPARALEVAVHERAEKNVWIRIVVAEGRYHLVKRLCEAVGLQIQRLYRPEFGGVTVEGLRAGEYRPLTPHETKAMRSSVGLGAPMPAQPQSPPKALPRAARRHGHGPPPVPGSEPVEAEARGEAEAGDAPGRRRGREQSAEQREGRRGTREGTPDSRERRSAESRERRSAESRERRSAESRERRSAESRERKSAESRERKSAESRERKSAESREPRREPRDGRPDARRRPASSQRSAHSERRGGDGGRGGGRPGPVRRGGGTRGGGGRGR